MREPTFRKSFFLWPQKKERGIPANPHNAMSRSLDVRTCLLKSSVYTAGYV